MTATIPVGSVALVGRCVEDNENLGLGYLEAALRAEGISSPSSPLAEVGGPRLTVGG